MRTRDQCTFWKERRSELLCLASQTLPLELEKSIQMRRLDVIISPCAMLWPDSLSE